MLNNAEQRLNNKILSIRSLNNVHYFDVRGGLSKSGKEAYWWELDDLLDKFEMGKVKLLPKIKPRLMQHRCQDRRNYTGHQEAPAYYPQGGQEEQPSDEYYTTPTAGPIDYY